MLFNSYEFILIYLPITFITYFTLAHKRLTRAATAWLVLASIAFYGYWDIAYVPLLLGSISFNYLCGYGIERSIHKKQILILGIVLDLSLLGYFKYTNFFLTNLNLAMDWNLDLPHIVMPLGISFFTFTQIAYLIDAWRGETHHYPPLDYALFVTVFPHLIAGPIIYHKDMIPQFSRLRNFIPNYRNIAMGISLFTLGLFKKVVIADTIAPWVNSVYAHASVATFLEAWIAAIGYTCQLYFDFSGYSEMAIGLGLLFNLHLPTNFNSPYQSASIIDFWRRWHMTLGTWVKYYLYIPLGGNRHGEFRKMFNLFLSMMLIGFWHGAGWTFIFWGCLHGCYLMINHQWRRLQINLPHPICRLLTFSAVVIAWVFFRAGSMAEALSLLHSMTTLPHSTAELFTINSGRIHDLSLILGSSYSRDYLLEAASVIGLLTTLLILCPNPAALSQKYLQPLRCPNLAALSLFLLFMISLYMLNQGLSPFLYFQF